MFFISPISNGTSELIDSQKENFGISAFLEKSKEYTKNSFPDLDLNSVFDSGIQGKLNISGFWGFIVELFGEELKSGISGAIAILIVIIIHSVLKAIIENLSDNNTGQIAYFVEYLAIISIITANFGDILLVTKNAINELINFMRLFIPILIALMFTTGKLASSSGLGSVIIIFINIIGTIISSVLIPLIMCSTVLGIVNSFSDKTQTLELSRFIKSVVLWILGIILTVFVCSLTFQGILSSSVDGLTSKTAKAAVSNFIPFVGKIMGDTIDTVIGCTNILKNTFGIIGVVILIGISIAPIIKISIIWFLIKLICAVCETIADPKIVKLLAGISESYKLLFGILMSCSIMFIVGITVVLRMTSIAV